MVIRKVMDLFRRCEKEKREKQQVASRSIDPNPA